MRMRGGLVKSGSGGPAFNAARETGAFRELHGTLSALIREDFTPVGFDPLETCPTASCMPESVAMGLVHQGEPPVGPMKSAQLPTLLCFTYSRSNG